MAFHLSATAAPLACRCAVTARFESETLQQAQMGFSGAVSVSEKRFFKIVLRNVLPEYSLT